jgi:hypothetical protein
MSVSLVTDPTAPTGTLSKSQQSVYDANVDSEFNKLLAGTDDSDPEKILAAITNDGMGAYWKWQIKEMEKKITQEVMSEHKVTAQDIAKMPSAQRIELEAKIIKEVKHRLEMWMDEQLRARKKQNEAGGSLSNQTLGTLLSQNEFGSRGTSAAHVSSLVPNATPNDLTNAEPWL